MKHILSILLLTVSLYAVTEKQALQEWRNFSPDQMRIMVKTWNYGKEHNLPWSLTAIAWKESKFGLVCVPLKPNKSSDYGITQINLNEYFRKNKIPNTRWNRSKYATMFIRDDEKALEEAVNILEYYNSIRPKGYGWRWVWARYNQGHNVDYVGKKYARDIATYIRVMKKITKGEYK
jgi:hypothetical protein